MSLPFTVWAPTVLADRIDFRAVYDDHVGFVWRAVRRLGLHENEAPDAVQEVFLVVHRRLSEYKANAPRAQFTTWLFAICLRVVQDHRRAARAKMRMATVAMTDDAEFVDETADPSTGIHLKQEALLLERILDRLPLEQRTVFVLFEIEGMSGHDTAKLLDVPTGTVHSRLRLAREAFQRTVNRMQERHPLSYSLREA